MDEMTELLLDAQDGDRLALGAWIRRAQPEVWRLCAHLVDHDAADDLTQETFLRAWRALDGYRAEASARTWLLAIARRACADELRSRRRRRRRDDRLGAGDTTFPDPTGEVDLTHAVGQLEGARRDAFVLTQVVGLTYAEAAEVCGCPVGTIRSRVARARGDLVDRLAPPSPAVDEDAAS